MPTTGLMLQRGLKKAEGLGLPKEMYDRLNAKDVKEEMYDRLNAKDVDEVMEIEDFEVEEMQCSTTRIGILSEPTAQRELAASCGETRRGEQTWANSGGQYTTTTSIAIIMVVIPAIFLSLLFQRSSNRSSSSDLTITSMHCCTCDMS